MSPSLVIFDMDGTLVDSSPVLAGAINHVRKHLYLPPMPHDQIIAAINDPAIDPAQHFYKIRTFAPEHERWFGEYYTDHHTTQLRLYDGIRDALDRLKTHGISIGLATNAYRVSTLQTLKHLEIEALFDAVVCADDVPRGKPDPAMLYRILSATNTDADRTVFVGDGPRDEQAARAAGIDYIMVDWGFTDHENKKVVKSVEGLKKELGVS